MTVNELRERLAKAQENVEKRKATIIRQTAQLEKKCDEARKLGCDPENDKSWKYANASTHDQYWAMCDVESKRDELESSGKKLKELEQIADNWRSKLESAEAKENCFLTEIPQALKNFKNYLVENWDEFDKKRRATLEDDYKKLGYKEFIKLHKYSGYNFMHLTDEEIHKENERTADSLIFDLFYRIKHITGKVENWNHLHVQMGHINGYVYGEDGSVKVESIFAGGYNIQRLHVRTLVHKIDKPAPKETKQAETKKVTNNNDYSQMTIEELEEIAEKMNIIPKKYDNQSIYRMRLVMAIKKAI